MQAQGFEVMRRLVPASACAALRADVLARAAASREAAIDRVMSDMAAGREGRMAASAVRSPLHRAHVSLPLTPTTREVLSLAATGVCGAFSRAGLDPTAARLVELSAMVSFPGAAAQTPHTDIPPYAPATRRLCTLWVALQDVTRTMGPTMVHPCPPEELCVRVAARFGIAGEGVAREAEEQTQRASGRRRRKSAPTRERSVGARVDPWAPEGLNLLPAVALLLSAGDACVVDGRFFHFGGANESATPRVLLSASFESTATAGGSLEPEDGFTYELLGNLEGKFVLGDFIDTSFQQAPRDRDM